MSVFNLEARRWLFCMTHPDDEISICGWMRKLVQNGNEVYLSWTHSTEVREKEGRSVAELIGIPDSNVFAFGATDGAVVSELGALHLKFDHLMKSVEPDVVVCGAFEQGHQDHDATNVLVNTTYKGLVLEIPFYHAYLSRIQHFNKFSDSSIQDVLDLEPEYQRLKLQVAKSYKSQNIWSLLVWYELWQALCLRPAHLSKRELLRKQTHFDWFTPNHPEPLRKKLLSHAGFQRWCISVRQYLEAQETLRYS
jgi:LmbE family N-acetylglucosaminyl deacetylase